MRLFPKAFNRLVQQLSSLPAIGERSATRLAYHLINSNHQQAEELAAAISQALGEVHLCSSCFFLCDAERCSICDNSDRDHSIVCVVEKPMDLVALERAGEYKGVYHVLHGLWAPIRGRDLDSIKFEQLVARCQDGSVKEVIIATSASVEGDATALYIARALSELKVPVTRLAQGLPKGGDLEFLDELTLSRAISGRNSLN